MSGVKFDQLLVAVVSDLPYNQQRLGREAKCYAEKISRARAPDLAEDQHEEVAMEAFAKFWKERGDPPEGESQVKVFRACVLAAIRIVRASYAPPGTRTRPVANKTQVDSGPPKILARQKALPEAEHQCPYHEDGSVALDGFASAAAARAMRAVEDAMDAAMILSRAPKPVARALHLIHFENVAVGKAAEELAISRFALNRRIGSFSAQWREAA